MLEKVSKFCKKCKKYRIDIDTFENHFEKCDPEKKKKDTEKHEPINTEGSKWFPCPFCEFKSLYEPRLKKHMTIKHIGMYITEEENWSEQLACAALLVAFSTIFKCAKLISN